MKSYIFAAAALVSAVANGAVIRREEDCDEPKAPTYGSSSHHGTNQTSGQGSNGTLPCGATSSTTYTVVAGDTLTTISTATGAGICDIAAASNVTNVNLITPGQVLTIPQGCTLPIDNTTCIATPDIPATETCVAGLPSTYTIVSGDTLTAIAKDFNITLDSLIGANTQIANPDAISVGQVINVPVCPNSQCAVVGTYTIVSGDLFVDLAATYKTTIGQIKALNPTVNATAIPVGQQIILPQNCANVTSTAAPATF